MSHIEILANGQKVRKKDILDDLKEFLERYEFYDQEVHRLWKDYEELEVENEKLNQENEWLKKKCWQLQETLMDYEWDKMVRKAIKNRNCRKRGYR